MDYPKIKTQLMNIAYNPTDNTVEIYDDLRTQYLIYKGVLILILTNTFIRIYKAPEDSLSYVQTIWAILGIISILFLALFLTRKSSAERIKLKNIKRLKVKSFLGRKRYVFILKNGKQRKLKTLQNNNDLQHLIHLCDRVGIPVCDKSLRHANQEEFAAE